MILAIKCHACDTLVGYGYRSPEHEDDPVWCPACKGVRSREQHALHRIRQLKRIMAPLADARARDRLAWEAAQGELDRERVADVAERMAAYRASFIAHYRWARWYEYWIHRCLLAIDSNEATHA